MMISFNVYIACIVPIIVLLTVSYFILDMQTLEKELVDFEKNIVTVIPIIKG